MACDFIFLFLKVNARNQKCPCGECYGQIADDNTETLSKRALLHGQRLYLLAIIKPRLTIS